MNEVFVIDREFLFKTNIHEITSISIEHNYDIDGSNVEGEFVVSGDYRLHSISINKENFSFKIPFTHELASNVNLDSVEVEITDFNYDFKNGDELSVHIEYTISGEQEVIEFEDEKDLDEFLDNNEVEVVDLKESPKEEKEVVEQTLDREEPALEIIKEENEIEMPKISEESSQNMILDNANYDDAFVKYHVHTVTMDDTLENICSKYGVSVNTLKKYNTFENLELNMKLLIPDNEEN